MEGFLKMVKRIKNRDLTPLFHMGIFVLTVVFIFAVMVFMLYRSEIQPREGVVIRKDYTPSYETTDYEYVYKSGESIRVPMKKCHGERYTITIKGINTRGKQDTGTYDVTPEEYRVIEIGDYYVKEKMEQY